MSLFRRFRRDKENESGTEPPASTEPSVPSEEPAPAAPTPPEEAPVPTSPAPVPDAPPRIPPPLPDRPAPEVSPPPPPPTDGMSKCFVCGTTLEGKTCPICRMTWVE